MLAIFKALPDYPLPASIKDWGGVTFDNHGSIVNATVDQRRFRAVAFSPILVPRLAEGGTRQDKNPYLRGWYAHGVREHVDSLIERGLPEQFSDLHSQVLVDLSGGHSWTQVAKSISCHRPYEELTVLVS